MGFKEKLFKMLGELNDEERDFLREVFSSAETEDVEQESSAEATDAGTGESVIDEATSMDEATEEVAENDTDVATDEVADSAEEANDVVDTEEPAEVTKAESLQEEAVTAEEDALTFDRTAPATDEEAPLQTDDGADLPVDSNSIIEGLNARIMALEAENSKLRAKTEGAFGFSSKPAGYAKVNPLYDDNTSDLIMRK